MPTRYLKLDDLKNDYPLYNACIVVLDYITVVGGAPESEIEYYLNSYYDKMTQIYRMAAILTLMEIGEVTRMNSFYYPTRKD